jgi:hypothetical protein
MLDRPRRIGRQKGVRDRHSGERGLEIIQIPLQLGLPDIAQFTNADRQGPAAGKTGPWMSGEIAGKLPLVACGHVEAAAPGAGPVLAAGDPRQYVVGKIRLRQFAVIDDVEAAFDLPFDDLCHAGSQTPVEFGLLDGFSACLREDHLAHIVRAREGPGMGRQNAIGAVKHEDPPCA